MRIPEVPRELPESDGHQGWAGSGGGARSPRRGVGIRGAAAACPMPTQLAPHTHTLTPRLFLRLPVAAELSDAGRRWGTGASCPVSERWNEGLRVLVVPRFEESLGTERDSPHLDSGDVCERLLLLFALGCDFWDAAGDLGALSRTCAGRAAAGAEGGQHGCCGGEES